MSDPTDDELREWWKGTHWSDPKPSDFGSLRLAFLAGRASGTPSAFQCLNDTACHITKTVFLHSVRCAEAEAKFRSVVPSTGTLTEKFEETLGFDPTDSDQR